MTKRNSTASIDLARARSKTYSFLANVLRCPDADMLKALSQPDRFASWKHDGETCLPELRPSIVAIHREIDMHRRSASALDQLRETYFDLFGHTVRGKCPPYEIEYGSAEIIQQSSSLADITGFYTAFGVEMIGTACERVDHASTQCEFMSVLATKCIHAIEHEDCVAQAVIEDAQASFLGDHLGKWFIALGHRLHRACPTGFYGPVGQLLQDFTTAECSRFDIPCGPQYLELKEPDPQRDTAIECGVEDGCPGAHDPSKQPLIDIRIQR
jgi:TorA maturation chaperone TorD